MKGRCRNNRCYENQLIVGKQYELEYDDCDADGVYVWFIGEDGKRWAGYTNRFEIVKENVMKIKKWSDLKDIRVGNKKIHYCHGCIDIRKENCSMINSFAIENYTTEELIGILKAIGLDIEFIKEPKLTKNDRQWLESMQFDYGDAYVKLVKKAVNSNINLNNTNCPYTIYLFNTLEYGKVYTISELLKLEVEE